LLSDISVISFDSASTARKSFQQLRLTSKTIFFFFFEKLINSLINLPSTLPACSLFQPPILLFNQSVCSEPLPRLLLPSTLAFHPYHLPNYPFPQVVCSLKATSSIF